MNTVPYGYARRRKHIEVMNPFKYRWIQKGDIYVALKDDKYIFGWYTGGLRGIPKPALVFCRSKDSSKNPDILVTGDGSTLFFVEEQFIEACRSQEHMKILAFIQSAINYHQWKYEHSHYVLPLEDVQSLFL